MDTGREFIDRVKRDVSIEAYISRYVKLKRYGNRATGLCPFHNEKTPSFSVSFDYNYYHCFGCGKSGDIFSFVMEYDKVSFPEAMRILSEYSGIPMQTSARQNSLEEKKKALYVVNDKVCDFFHNSLFSPSGRPALDYLLGRGVSEKEIRFFRIGFAPPGFQNLSQSCLQTEQEVQLALSLGLLKSSERRKGEHYDFFRERIMFPILERSGHVVGFGGRKLNELEKGGKYINSPASILFEKGKLFYNLNHAAAAIRKSRTAIIVEGYLDVIGLVSKEIDHVVAPLGTALTESHVRSLKNYADNLIIMLDGDDAGRKAAFRAGTICLREGVNTNVLILDSGMDPFDIAQKSTRMEIDKLLAAGLHLSEFMLTEVLGNVTPGSVPESKKAALQNLFAFVKSFDSESDKQLYLDWAARKLGLATEAVISDFYANHKQIASIRVKDNSALPVPTKAIRLERTIIARLILYNDLFEFQDRIHQMYFFDSESSFLWEYLYTRYINGESITPTEVLSSELPSQTLSAIAGHLMEDKIDDIEYVRSNFIEKLDEQEKIYLENEMKKLNSLEDFARLKELKSQIEQLDNRIRNRK